MKTFKKLNDFSAYQIAFHLSNYTWDKIQKFDYFAKDTAEKQFVDSIDSISANIAEGFGRYNRRDQIKFYRYSRGSVMKELDWNEKAKRRGLIPTDQYDYFIKELQKLPREFNELIKYTD